LKKPPPDNTGGGFGSGFEEVVVFAEMEILFQIWVLKVGPLKIKRKISQVSRTVQDYLFESGLIPL
jgi:hypothetical protein